MSGIGKLLVICGLAMAGLGLLLIAGERFSIRIGKLPGDIVWQGKNTTFYFPVVTCILISLILTLVMWLFGRR